MKVAVVGANGQLGSDLVAEFRSAGDEIVGFNHAELDISSLESARGALIPAEPAVIVNTAAMHHVENCEKDPLRAFGVNGLGAKNLATVARELDAKLVHVSTDYVFDGSKRQPYIEDDLPSPLNVYGNTKVAGEMFVKATTEKHFIVRSSALYGKSPCRAKGGRNFVETMLKLAGERDQLRVVNDEVVSPTSTAELATQIRLLCRSDRYGLYHATSEGSCTWYEFAKKIFELTHTAVNLQMASENEFPAKVPRPKYSVLENARLKQEGLDCFQRWDEGLRSYLAERGALVNTAVSA